MRAYSVTVTDARIQLIAADNKNRTAYLNIIGNEAVAIGDETVTYATGLRLVKHSAAQAIVVPQGETLFAICDTAKSDDVRVLLPDAD